MAIPALFVAAAWLALGQQATIHSEALAAAVAACLASALVGAHASGAADLTTAIASTIAADPTGAAARRALGVDTGLTRSRDLHAVARHDELSRLRTCSIRDHQRPGSGPGGTWAKANVHLAGGVSGDACIAAGVVRHDELGHVVVLNLERPRRQVPFVG